MKNILVILFLISTSATIFAQKTIDVSDFSGVSLKTSADVYITPGNTFKVTVEGDEETLEDTDIYVRGGMLIIDNKDNNFSWFGNRNRDLEVMITMPKLEEVSVSGSGNLVTKGKFSSERLELNVSGSGDLEIEADARQTEASISGSGKIYIKGSTDRLDMSISGSGRIRGEDFKAKTCYAKISGSGSCEIYVEEEIDAKISGSGSIYYDGNPQRVNSHSSGSGKVRKM